MNTIITLEDAQLLQDAKRVFGVHLITRAWFADNCEPTHANRERLELTAQEYTPDETGCISVPTHGMVIFEFLNGRRVAFNTSEWAFISSVEDHLVAL